MELTKELEAKPHLLTPQAQKHGLNCIAFPVQVQLTKGLEAKAKKLGVKFIQKKLV